MSAMAGLKLPKGVDQFTLSNYAGQSADIYSQLSKLFPEMLQKTRGGPEAFDAIEGTARRNFNQVTAPGIANRYAGSGIGSSSGLHNSLSNAGKNLDLDLASKRADYMDKSMGRVLQLGQLLLQNPDMEHYYGNSNGEGGGDEDSFWDKVLGIGLPLAGTAAGFIPGFGPAIGGPAGGAALGGALAKGLRGR